MAASMLYAICLNRLFTQEKKPNDYKYENINKNTFEQKLGTFLDNYIPNSYSFRYNEDGSVIGYDFRKNYDKNHQKYVDCCEKLVSQVDVFNQSVEDDLLNKCINEMTILVPCFNCESNNEHSECVWNTIHPYTKEETRAILSAIIKIKCQKN